MKDFFYTINIYVFEHEKLEMDNFERKQTLVLKEKYLNTKINILIKYCEKCF